VKPTDGLIFVDPREVQIRGVSSPVQIFSLAKKGVFAQGAES
jgi:hypothetical protein